MKLTHALAAVLIVSLSACCRDDKKKRRTWPNLPLNPSRYVYLLDAAAETPIVPPNLDTPVGTLCRIKVAADAQPISSGLVYGSLPNGASQKIPATGAAPQLLEDSSYRLHVLSDLGFALANCYFTYLLIEDLYLFKGQIDRHFLRFCHCLGQN